MFCLCSPRNLSKLNSEYFTKHTHAHLSLYINGIQDPFASFGKLLLSKEDNANKDTGNDVDVFKSMLMDTNGTTLK